MRKPVKIVAIVASVVLVLVIALVIAAKVLITPERVRATVLPIAEEHLERKVDFKGLNVSIFSGITLEGFTVFEADGQERFVSLEGLVLRFRIFPLLLGKVVVDEVRLDRPQIHVVREADGSFNFSSIGARKEAVEAPTQPPAGEGSSGGGIDLLVSRVAIRGGEVAYRDLALQPGKPFALTVNEVAVDARDISLERSFPLELKAMLAGAPLELSAQVDPRQASGDGKLALKGLALKTFRDLAGPGYPAHLEPLTVDLDVSGAGSAEKAGAKGTVTLHLAGQEVRLRFDAPALMDAPLPFALDLNADQLLLDKLLPPEQPAGKSSGKGGAPGSSEEIGPFDLPLKGKGNISIGKLSYNGLVMDKAEAEWSLENNVFVLKRLAAGAAGGKLDGKARIDLGRKGLVYQSSFALDSIQSDPLVTAFYPAYAGAVQGGLDLSLGISGRGTQGEAIKRNLSGDGTLLIREGRVSGAPLVEGLAAFLGSEELKVLSFRETQGTFTIKDGRLAFDSTVDGSQARMRPNGHVGLDGSLDVRLETRLNPELTRKVAGKGDFAGALKDDEGWGLFPLRVKGSVNKPSFTLDSKAVRRQAEQKVKEKLVDELLKESGGESSGEKALKETLKGLFGN